MNNEITIENLLFSMGNIQIVDGNIEKVLLPLNNAKDELNKALNAMSDITVKGKESMNVLLGCIIAIEKILGNKGE